MALSMNSPAPGRLTHPLIRENGQLRRASWDEALSVAARAMRELRDAHGADAFSCFSCSKSSNELNYLAQKFMRTAIGTNNIDSCNRT